MKNEPRRMGPPIGNSNARKPDHLKRYKVTADVCFDAFAAINAEKERTGLSRGQIIDRMYRAWRDHEQHNDS